MKRLLPITLALLFLLLVLGVSLAVAQGDPPPPEFPDLGPADQTPIDGGLIWLLIGGGIYGIKKLKDRNNSTTEK